MSTPPESSGRGANVISTPLGPRTIYRLDAVAELGNIDALPYTIKILLESCLRNHDGTVVTDDHIRALASYDATAVAVTEIPFVPGRVILQDFTGVPAVVDLAAMRSAMVRLGGDPDKVNPLVPSDLVVHSCCNCQVLRSGSDLATVGLTQTQRLQEVSQLVCR